MVKFKSINKTMGKTVTMSDLKQMPEGILILGVLMFVGSFFSFLLALAMFNVANPVNYQNLLLQFQALGQAPLSSIYFIGMGVLFIVFGVICYFVGKGLLRLDNRARIVLIIILILGIALSIVVMFLLKQYYTSIFLIILQLIALRYATKKKLVSIFN